MTEMDKVRASRQAGVETWEDDEKLNNFMAIFHPEKKLNRRDIREMRR
tara:strand:- start:834 stop:977 length:144 start_codon:yes stop_codon:yes gene_type:complete